MALFAVCAQIGIVRIFVTTVAIAERHAGKSLERFPVSGLFFVALHTSHRFVFAQQRKIGLVVVKITRRRKSRRGMAPGAIVRQGVLVGIRVAGFAIFAESQKSIAPFF